MDSRPPEPGGRGHIPFQRPLKPTVRVTELRAFAHTGLEHGVARVAWRFQRSREGDVPATVRLRGAGDFLYPSATDLVHGAGEGDGLSTFENLECAAPTLVGYGLLYESFYDPSACVGA